MTASAADWSEHDLGPALRRRRRAPTSSASWRAPSTRCWTAWRPSLRHEQRLSAELSHELRTPLARIVGRDRAPRSAASARPRSAASAYAVVARSAEQMSAHPRDPDGRGARRGAARRGPQRGRRRPRPRRRRAGRRRWPSATSSSRSRHAAGPMTAGVDAEVVERIVAPLIDNAAALRARAVVLIGAVARDGRVLVLSVADDGPGVRRRGARARLRARGPRRRRQRPRRRGARPAAGAPPGPRRPAATSAPQPRDGAGATFVVDLPA